MTLDARRSDVRRRRRRARMRRWPWRALRIWRWLWAAPYSLVGGLIGCVALVTGGGAQWRGRVLEFHGGAIPWWLDRLPLPHVLAMTLGHTVIGRTSAALDDTRAHERVHVRQFERWGPLMGPAYLGCSAILWICGWDAYRDNPFEREAFLVEQPSPGDHAEGRR